MIPAPRSPGRCCGACCRSSSATAGGAPCPARAACWGGYGAQTASWGMSAYFAGFLPGARLAPRMIRRVGHVRVFAAPGATTSAAFVPYAKAVHPPPG